MKFNVVGIIFLYFWGCKDKWLKTPWRQDFWPQTEIYILSFSDALKIVIVIQRFFFTAFAKCTPEIFYSWKLTLISFRLQIHKQSKKHHIPIFATFLLAFFIRTFYCFTAITTAKTELECEFPPKMEEDLTHVRRKRLTTRHGLVCLEDYPYTVSIR